MFQEMQDKDIFEQARDYAYEYANTVQERTVFPSSKTLEQLKELDGQMPSAPGNPQHLLEELHRFGSPATVAQTGGRYFGLVNGGVIPASLAARWLSDFWDQNTPLYVTSPVVSQLEHTTERWLKRLLGLPDAIVAGFVSGSSMAILCGLAAGRYRLFKNQGWDINEQGFCGAPKINIVAGRHAHGTVIKAAALLGFGVANIQWVDCDDQGRIDIDKIPPLDQQTLLILQAGNVNSGAFDDFSIICKRAKEAGSWVHVDGAFGLWAAASERLKHLTQGMEDANSFSVDGHKTLNTPYDNGIVLCNDEDALVKALQASGSYILYNEKRDGMMYTPEMSRRARVVELWAALKYLGESGVDELVYGLHEKAVEFSLALEEEGFQILNKVVFNQILVGFKDDHCTHRIIEHIQRSGECWVGGGSWEDKAVIRISVCSWATTKEDIARSVRAFVAARDAVPGASP
ncbi:aminotransferase class V-fold PLP-dependent enzyme [Pseudoteredinibacter isoporae]|nr:aminotransferase class V-fold PLP-dependent enzyme [Pseudoteredinibacter isoporae]NHO87954.1 aminotransferase class V-fold PLP-dependent enzyme [Pseudoteredinibacter isoporae]NIB23715.1 aminotransferase class V-fold PLP-dependent enzyme [Pseudoteredinibacter isoporae]